MLVIGTKKLFSTSETITALPGVKFVVDICPILELVLILAIKGFEFKL